MWSHFVGWRYEVYVDYCCDSNTNGDNFQIIIIAGYVKLDLCIDSMCEIQIHSHLPLFSFLEDACTQNISLSQDSNDMIGFLLT